MTMTKDEAVAAITEAYHRHSPDAFVESVTAVIGKLVADHETDTWTVNELFQLLKEAKIPELVILDNKSWAYTKPNANAGIGVAALHRQLQLLRFPDDVTVKLPYDFVANTALYTDTVAGRACRDALEELERQRESLLNNK